MVQLCGGDYDSPVQAILLAAGLGTRLRPLTDLRPKPIVPVANRPLAAFAMHHLTGSGVRTLIVNTHPQPEKVESVLRAECTGGVSLRFSREPTLLGTGGGLRKAHGLCDDAQASVIVMNGDTLFAPNLRRALDAHSARRAVATMILRRTPDPQRFGAIGIDAEGWVRTILGLPNDGRARDHLMFTGTHILAPEAFAAMPRSGCVIRTAYRTWVDSGAPVLGIIDESPWADLGTIADYHRLNLDLASGLLRWPGVEPRSGCILPASMEAGDNVRRSVIGEGTILGEGVSLDRCVVWPDTTVAASATGAILTPKHRIEAS